MGVARPYLSLFLSLSKIFPAPFFPRLIPRFKNRSSFSQSIPPPRFSPPPADNNNTRYHAVSLRTYIYIYYTTRRRQTTTKKTSLLDTLSGRSTYDSGSLTVDSVPVIGSVKKSLKRCVAYIKQDDVFFTHLTVRDQLTYTALLRLPEKSMTTAQKHEEVEKIVGNVEIGFVRRYSHNDDLGRREEEG